jgi:hypothetical protein
MGRDTGNLEDEEILISDMPDMPVRFLQKHMMNG